MDGLSIYPVENVKKLTKSKHIYFITIIAVIIVAVASIGVALLYQEPDNSPTLNGLTVTDDTGYTLTLDKYPERIVSLAPGNTQILFAVGAGDNVVGVTDYCTYPYDFSTWVAAGNMTSIGNYYDPAIEPIVALNPDLIVAALGSEDVANQLRSLNYNVLVLNPADLDGILKNLLLVGKATGYENQATDLVASLQQRIDTITDAVATITTKPKVYVELYSSPYMSVGSGTFIDGLITLAGGQNIYGTSPTAYPEANVEFIKAQNPDIIIFPDSMGDDLLASFAGITERAGWDSIKAIQNNALYIVDADALNQPGPRQVDALEAFAQILHPEIFGEYAYP